MTDNRYLDGEHAKSITESELAGRPSLTSIQSQYEELTREVQQEILLVLPGHTWESRGKGRTSTCGAESNPNIPEAKTLHLPIWSLAVRPTPEQWTEILSRITPIAESEGFKTAAMNADVGTGTSVTLDGEYRGATFNIGYNKALTVNITTGCHLTD